MVRASALAWLRRDLWWTAGRCCGGETPVRRDAGAAGRRCGGTPVRWIAGAWIAGAWIAGAWIAGAWIAGAWIGGLVVDGG
jgi:hypothetical protein